MSVFERVVSEAKPALEQDQPVEEVDTTVDSDLAPMEPTEIVTPKSHAYMLYLEGRLTNKEIAETAGCTLNKLQGWIKTGQWRDLRSDLERDSMLRANDSFAKFVMSNREVIARRQIDQASDLQNMIDVKIKKRKDGSVPHNDARDLNMLADALKKVSDITSRIVGIHEKSLSEIREIATETKKEEVWIKEIQPILKNQKNLQENTSEPKALSRPSPF